MNVNSSFYYPELRRWRQFYKHLFDDRTPYKMPDVVPDDAEEFPRIILVKQGFTLGHILDMEWISGWGLMLDHHVFRDLYIESDRTPIAQSYAILVRDTLTADQKYRDWSAEEVSAQGVKGITLLERMLLELYTCYFKRDLFPSMMLDEDTFTLCSGTRTPQGNTFAVGLEWDFLDPIIEKRKWTSKHPKMGIREVRVLI